MKKYKVIDTNRFYKLPGDCIEHMLLHIDKVIGFAILKWGESNLSKGQLISEIVGIFVADLLRSFCPKVTLDSVLCDDIGRVDLNMVLDRLGRIGTRIGALAYVVAIMLETLLPDDDKGTSDILWVQRYEDHTCKIIDEQPPTSTILISACYTKYIDNDSFVYATFLKPNIDRLKEECE